MARKGDAGQLALAGGGAESGGGSGGDAASADEGCHTHVSLSSSSLLRPWPSTPASGLLAAGLVGEAQGEKQPEVAAVIPVDGLLQHCRQSR